MHRSLLVALPFGFGNVALAAQAPDGLEIVAAVSQELASVAPGSCEATVDGAKGRLRALDSTTVDATWLAAHPHAADAMWTVQLQAWSVLRALHGEGPVGEGCVDAFRRLDLALRGAIDVARVGDGAGEAWLTTEELDSFADLRSGDVLVTRGSALSSAGIAHIGAVDASFSHNAMVYVDPEGRAWTVEAYLEQGAIVQLVEDFLAHGLGRVTIVRYEDEALAARAARLAWQRVGNGPAIRYDEAFDDGSHDELFCSEIVPWAFALAGGPGDVPLHRTRFDHEATPGLFASMGIEVPDLGAPADLLFDPRFRVVGAWRDLELLPELHRQDAVVDGLFRHLEATGTTPLPTWTHRATVDVGLSMRRTPVLRGLVRGQVHPDGDRQFLVAALALQDAGQRLYDAVWSDAPAAWVPRRVADARVDRALREDAEARGGRGARGGVHRLLR